MIKAKLYTIFIICSFFLMSCQQNHHSENVFSVSNDTLIIKTTKHSGSGLFDLGYGFLKFKDTSEKFLFDVKLPNKIDNLKRYELKVDFREKEDFYVELMEGKIGKKDIFIVDSNNNKDFTDDPIRYYKNFRENSNIQLIKSKFQISNGKTIVRDSSWIKISKTSDGRVLLGRREFLLGRFKIDNKEYEIGITEPRNILSFTYGFQPTAGILSHSGIKKDSLYESDLINLGEYLNLDSEYYRFEKISNNGDFITLVKDNNFNLKIGTQKGMIAPEFKAKTITGKAIESSVFQDKITVIANSCGCGGDIESTKSYYNMEEMYGNKINIIHVDSDIDQSSNGIHIDSEKEFNKDFYKKYRQKYCSRISYVIGKNKRVLDKFNINKWETFLPKFIK